jgi:hypothetical protein
MNDEPFKVCPSCGSTDFHKVMTVPMYCSVRLAKSEIKTVGHLAHRNSEEMDKQGILPPGIKKPENKLAKKISKMNDRQKKDYIEKGIL